MQTNNQLILLLVIAVTALLFIIGLFFIFFFYKYNKNLKEKQNEAIHNLIKGQLLERNRIAQDLHDGIGADMGSIIHVLDEIESENQDIIKSVNKAKQRIKDTMKSIRQISHDLIPSELNLYGLIFAIENLIEKEKNSGISISFNTDLLDKSLDSYTEFQLYKITQELFNNVLKHSNANQIIIGIYFLKNKKQTLYFFSDNGQGFNDIENSDGIGLKNIRTRAASIGGKLTIDSTNGFKISININNE